MSEIIKIPIEQLEVGMVVVKFDKGGFAYSYYGKPFPDAMLKQFLLRNGVQFAFVKRESVEREEPPVDTSPEAGRVLMNEYLESLEGTKKKVIASAAADVVATAPTIRELSQAMVVHTKAKQVAEKILLDAKMGKVMDTEAAKDVVAELVDHCIKSPEAFVNMTRLKDFDNYTFTHSVNVAVLAIAIGRRLGSSAQEMNNMGFAGLMHDIGKMHVPENILNKPGKLTEEEYQIMKMHPVYGHEYLRTNSKGVSEEILLAVRHHHEKSDGSGYPDGIFEKDIPKFAKIISIADVYDAITSERTYHKGLVPSDALKIIFSWSGKHFNDSLVKFFISIMGIYPVGTLVMLNTNELGVILEPNKNDPMRPKVLVISNAAMEPAPPSFFDLSSYNVTTQMPYKSIVSALDPRDFSIDPNRVIEQYIRSKNP